MSSPSVLRVGLLADTVLGGGGMARYAREVLAALGRHPEVEVVAVVPEEARELASDLAGSGLAGVVPIRGGTKVLEGLWERGLLGRVLERRGCHLVHGVKHVVPRTSLPTVLTVQDMMPLTSAEQFSLVKRLLLPSQYRASIEATTVLVVVSQATRRRLLECVPGVEDRIVMVPNGVGPDLLGATPSPVAGLAGGAFALVVGDLSPRKNVAFLVEIWPEVHRRSGLRLAIVGPDGWRSQQTRAAVDDAVRAGLAVRLQGIDDGALRWCYEHARVVLCPSVEEGYGLPVVEALALGARVVASTDEAFREVSQGRATHLEADDRAGWVEAIVAGERRDPTLEPFVPATWDEHAAGLVAAYRKAMG